MKTTFSLTWTRSLCACGVLAVSTLAAASLHAQSPAVRIGSEISSAQMGVLKGSQHPMAQPAWDSGRMPANYPLQGITLFFQRSPAQEADLKALLAAQQDPASALYHQWLTPDQYAARFGMAQADIEKVEDWLQQQGFSIETVSRSHNMIHFSGTVGQVEQAFHTQMHFYTVNGEKNFAPSTALSIPAALSGIVLNVGNLDTFRPQPHVIKRTGLNPSPSFTSATTHHVFFAPGDIQTVYDMKTLTGGGTTGVGQSIAVLGQSEVAVSDIEHFQSAAGLTVKDPTQVLVPGSGTPAFSSGDEGESDLDLEWSGATATGAQIFFVYTGNNTNYGVFDSAQYAVDERIANILTLSYGACELGITTTNFGQLDAIASQAASQGQTFVSSSGDQGSTSCYGVTSLSTAQQAALSVNYPASSAYVTGVGGTEITSADDAVGTYWTDASGSDLITSATKYIPEVSWNDDSTTGCTSSTGASIGCLSSSGGGVSTFYTTKPTWQAGVPGIPNDNKRDVPDVSLYSSPALPGYLFCTSDTSDWATASGTNPAQQNSCNSGFRDSATGYLTVAGGTSFAAPIFAGMVAILNQNAGYASGQGLLNTALYSLASNAATYSAAFHDTVTGNNNCLAGSVVCPNGPIGFTAGVGYDQVTGLGSVDLGLLATAWTKSSTTLVPTTTTLTASNLTPNASTPEPVTISVASATGTSVPSGNVTLQIDGGTNFGGTTVAAQPISTSGTLTYSASFSTSGYHQILAQYAGDTSHAASVGVITFNVGGGGSTAPGIALAATPTTLTVSRGTQGTETITVTPAGGYTGTIDVSFTSSNNSALANLCYQFSSSLSNGDGSVVISGANSTSVTLSLDTNAADCASSGGYPYGYGYGFYAQHGKWQRMGAMAGFNTSRNNKPSPLPEGFALAGLLLIGYLGRKSRNLRNLTMVLALMVAGFAISACGGGGVSAPSNPAKGTYTMTVNGVDTKSKSITSKTNFTFVID
ncbi:MAG: Ig-like domain repeat protein [Acidobacteriota bacterium]|nr:Ig-like domain repeat protein [Acidobacteriota bacterium]